jgi:toxin secretion/phage lysis holin
MSTDSLTIMENQSIARNERRDQEMMQTPPFSMAAALKWLAAFIIGQWIQIPGVMKALIYLMFIDYGTGLVCAFVKKRISSRIGALGLFQKGMIIVLLVSADLFEKALGIELHLATVGGLAYCANEFISIVENCANAGVPVPQKLVRAMLSVKNLRFVSASDKELAELRMDNDEDRDVEQSDSLRSAHDGEAKKR